MLLFSPFSVLINDMYSLKLDNELRGFADDTKLFGCVCQQKSLAHDIALVCGWCDANGLKLNYGKCSVMHLGNHNPCHEYKLGNEPLCVKALERDLGVWYDHQFKFRAHIEDRLVKCYKLINLFFKLFPSEERIQTVLYKLYVRPVLEFGLPAWSPRFAVDNERIERIQKYFTRRLCGSSKSGGPKYQERLERLKLQKLSTRRLSISLTYVYKSVVLGSISPTVLGLSLSSVDCTRGHRYKLQRDSVNTAVRQSFFSQSVVPIWNALPEAVFNSVSLEVFKRFLKSRLE